MVLCRLRIGHSFVTHRYLLVGEDQPGCISRQEPPIVDHILFHSIEYHRIREHYITMQTRKQLLEDITQGRILNF